MCGILTFTSNDGIDIRVTNKFKKSLDLLKHRGPDNTSFISEGNVLVGHTRLSIIDSNAESNQPFYSTCKRFIIAFNGEIYNYKELEEKYNLRSRMTTNSDTEVLAELWSIKQERCLEELDGMFAIVAYDRIKKKLTLARDIFGIKPLYFCRTNEGMIISSELKPILEFNGEAKENIMAIKRFVADGLLDSTEETFFDNIFAIKPGSYSEIETNTLNTRMISYFSIDTLIENKSYSQVNNKERTDHLYELLEKCGITACSGISKIGVNVSGGIDSTLLYNIMNSKQSHIKYPGYNIQFEGTEDDLYIQKHLKDYQYQRFRIDEMNILEHLKDTVRFQEEPFSGIFTVAYSYLYNILKDRGIRVMMDGNGLDEFFLGYNKYRICENFKNRHHDGSKIQIDNILHKRLQADLSETGKDTFLKDNQNITNARRESLKDIFKKKIPRVLRFNDRVSMQHSIELRVPFLRRSILEAALKFKDEELMNRSLGKLPIRTILAKKFNISGLTKETKASIQTHQTEWLTGSLNSLTEYAIVKSNLFDRAWVNADSVKSAIENQVARKQNNSFFLWQMISLELWAQSFLD